MAEKHIDKDCLDKIYHQKIHIAGLYDKVLILSCKKLNQTHFIDEVSYHHNISLALKKRTTIAANYEKDILTL